MNQDRIITTLLLIAVVFTSILTAKGATPQETIAITILGEARGEGESGMYAVACVIAQRMKDRGKTGEEICLQRLQFSCNNNGLNTRLLQCPQADYAMMLARNITNLDLTFVGGANHYHTRSVRPYWSKGKLPVKTIGNHVFFRL